MKKYFQTITKFSTMPPKPSKSAKSSKKEKEVIAKPIITDSVSELKSCDIAIKISGKPGSKENKIVGNSEDGLEIKIAAPAVDGEANSELILFLSKIFNVKKSDLSLERGSKSRTKIVTISKETGLTVERIREIINDSINK